jgi:hypothetical protein
MVVIVMKEHASERSGNDPSALQPGRALYAQGVHWMARTGHGFMLLLYLVGVVGVVSTFSVHPLGWADAAGFFMLIAVPLVIASNLRTCAVFGAAEGLEIVRWGKRRTVPWSKVGTAEYAWWSVNSASRIARLTVLEERERTILFFANDRILAELERMRAAYAGR